MRKRRQLGPPPVMVTLICRYVVLLPCFLIITATQQYGNAQQQPTATGATSLLGMGHPSCPCLVNPNEVPPMDDQDRTSPQLEATLGARVNSTTYGMACRAHDYSTPQCSMEDSVCAKRLALVPAPLGCDLSWCQRKWCYVDPKNCTLAHRRHPSFVQSDRFYSYATCGDMDAFTSNRRFASLENQVFKIGLNANTGGWLGSYRADGIHFAGPITKWSGLAIDFVIKAAYRGRFMLELQEPPVFLRERSQAFFGSVSQFDLCVYSTSLGYLDMCVAQYTITDQRASSTDWLVLGSSGIYLVVNTGHEHGSIFEEFLGNIATIFQPFTAGTWAFIVFFAIPALGCLMIVHERGKVGSTYPTEEAVVVVDARRGESVLRKRPVPVYRNIVKSIYIAFLAVLQQSYEQSVLTLGAMLNLLGISFFILTIIAVYTANLAAMLTQNVQTTTIDSFEDAVRSGYRLCSERKNMETILNIYPNLDPTIFVADPLDLGGDGLPGFSCLQCNSRMRVFDFMDPGLANVDSRYCHAAIAPSEDIDVVHAASTHCNKTIIGKAITHIQTGMPIFETVSPQLISFMLKLKNEGQYDAAVIANKPKSKCPIIQQGEGSALNLTQLSGIWVVSFGFAFAGLAATFFQNWYKKRLASKDFKVHRVHKRDQKGGRIDALGLEDSWMTAASESCSPIIGGGGKPALLQQGSTAGSIRLVLPGNDQGRSSKSITGNNSSSGRAFCNLASILRRPSTRINGHDDPDFRENKEPQQSPNPTPITVEQCTSRGEELDIVVHPEQSFGESVSFSESVEASVADTITSVHESREKLRNYIDQQARLSEGVCHRSPDLDNHGSLELLSAIDELAFVPSFSKESNSIHV